MQMLAVRALIFRPQIHPLHGPQDVAGSQNHHDSREHGEHVAELPDGQYYKHFADESAQSGQAEAGEKNQDCHRGVERHFAKNAAELVQVAVVHAVVQYADHKEHAGGADAVGDHLKHGPLHTHVPVIGVVAVAGQSRPHAQAEHDVAHVADGTIGDETLEIGLGHRRKRAVNHAHHAEDADEPHQVEAALWADGIADAENAVAAHLEQHAGQNH